MIVGLDSRWRQYGIVRNPVFVEVLRKGAQHVVGAQKTTWKYKYIVQRLNRNEKEDARSLLYCLLEKNSAVPINLRRRR